MPMRAAVLHRIGDEALEVVDDAELEGVGPGTVRVAIRATGICHSDLSAMTGTFPIHVFRGNRIPVGSTPLDVLCCKLLFATRLLTPGSETTACHLFCSRH